MTSGEQCTPLAEWTDVCAQHAGAVATCMGAVFLFGAFLWRKWASEKWPTYSTVNVCFAVGGVSATVVGVLLTWWGNNFGVGLLAATFGYGAAFATVLWIVAKVMTAGKQGTSESLDTDSKQTKTST